MMIEIDGKRLLKTERISLIAAPVGEVIMPIWDIDCGIVFFDF